MTVPDQLYKLDEETVPDDRQVIYTIGHSILKPYELIKLLVLNHIEVVVDVRSIPYSRAAPQFNKKSIEETLRDSGFDYRFGGKYLGAYPDGKKPPHGYKPDWRELAGRKAFQTGIRRLRELSKTQVLVLLCAEENPYRCHRHHLITPELIKTGFRVVHIRHNGDNEEVKSENGLENDRQITLFE